MANRFKDEGLRKMYDTCITLAHDPDSEFYVSPNGLRFERRSGASHRNAFWAGVDGMRPHWVEPGTLGYAAWAAGRDFGREQGT